MLLTELFNKAADIVLKTQNSGSIYAKVDIGGRELGFKLGKWPKDSSDPKSNWTFTFVEYGDEDEDDEFDLYDEGETYNVTGSGNEFEVFATAKKFLELAIKKVKPDVIHFEADKTFGENRAKLYTRMIKRWSPPGYHHEIHPTEESDYYKFIKNT